MNNAKPGLLAYNLDGSGAASRIRSPRFNMHADVWGAEEGAFVRTHCGPRAAAARGKFRLGAPGAAAGGGRRAAPSGARVALGPRGPGRMRGPGARPRGEAAGALTWCAGRAGTGPRAAGPRRGAGPGRWVAAAATAPARGGPCPPTRLPPPGSRAAAAHSLGCLGAATLLPPAASLGAPHTPAPVPAPEAGLRAALPGMSPRAPGLSLQVLAFPSLPRPSPHPRAPPRSATASGPAAPGERGRGSWGPEGGPGSGKGLGAPDDEPLEARRTETPVQLWKRAPQPAPPCAGHPAGPCTALGRCRGAGARGPRPRGRGRGRLCPRGL